MKIKVKIANKKEIKISTEFIKLDSALKLANAVESGGQAKFIIQNSEVKVNSEICTVRGKKLRPGDTFEFNGLVYIIK